MMRNGDGRTGRPSQLLCYIANAVGFISQSNGTTRLPGERWNAYRTKDPSDLALFHLMISKMSIENERILRQMLDACSSVTTSALSCPTLGSATLRQALAAGTGTSGGFGVGNEVSEDGSNDKSVAGETVDANNDGMVSSATTAPSTVSANEAAEYADEVEIARWLDSQIAEYQAALARHDEEDRLLATSSSGTAAAVAIGNAAGQKRKRRDAGSGMDATRRQKERELKRLREDIFDETVRVQQERLLISRMRMSAAAVYTTFPDAAPRPGNAKDTGIASERSHDPIDLDTKSEAMKMVPNSEEEAHAAQLRREGIRARDQLVASGLEKIGDIQLLRSRLENTNATCREWQQKNRDLWNKITSATNVGVEETGSSDEYRETIRRENDILKRALAEAIASSGIDWFGDERLSNAFAMLED